MYSEMVHTAMSWFAPVKLEGGDWSDIDKAIMEVFFDVLLSGGKNSNSSLNSPKSDFMLSRRYQNVPLNPCTDP